ncbi:BZ3500_MvSof-1268-A1-R1_Chr2-1g04283 [Microbotryum saponariae]|uniref:BZ3500_MvSof-1268-A1-R1_Chr2-1g04283 protein n=1 Tax=Microbotryum saponariae TaxID=289078 RepID=A0A2X0MAW5_9BASI|nr:BZ3500_MvSof-1268-A1-R1_Chr2-1g04283 [Microbotryum saponariae]SCZ91318.1 BZ3501_MvSof-1269-A2-R1_Chr2-1g03939 [Microbotryum saponariae]
MSRLLQNKHVGIKKPTHGHQLPKEGGSLRLDHTLIDRCQQWKHVDKSLLHYFEGLAAIQHTTAKATLALQETIQVPFHEGHQFLGEGGWQEILYSVRDQTKVLAEAHSNFGETIEKTVVKELQGVRAEIKAHIAALEKEASLLADDVEKERANSTQLLTQLQTGIETYESSDSPMLPQHDPYLTHSLVQTQLKKQIHKENDLQAALIRFQQQQPAFEEGIAKSIQSACKLFDEAKATKDDEFAKLTKAIGESLQKVSPTAEYEFWSAKEGALLDVNAPTRSVDAIIFPGLDHAATQSIKEGHLERKKRFTKSYAESYYILTPSGYLHERKTSSRSDASAPGFSLFLPECVLGPPSGESDKSHKFHVEGNKAVKSSFESKVKNSLRFGGKEIAYTFRARTHAEMMGWWKEMDQLTRETKTQVPKAKLALVTPVDLAVAQVGLPVEGGQDLTTPIPTAALHPEEDEEESGGSSAEEEDDEARAIRTAPTTPAVGSNATSPLDHAGAEHAITESESGQGKAETLPTYAGNTNNVAVAEKDGVKSGPPALAEPTENHASTSSSS